MLSFQPSQPNESGQIYAGLALQGAQGLAAGITNAGHDVSDAMKQLHQYHMAQQQATGSILAAKGLEDQVDQNGNMIKKGILPAGFTNNLLQMDPMSRIGAAHDLPQILSSAVMGQYRQGLINYDQQKIGLGYDRLGENGGTGGAMIQWNANGGTPITTPSQPANAAPNPYAPYTPAIGQGGMPASANNP